MTNSIALAIAILASIEAGGRLDAVGDGGRAVGILQMWPVCVQEANRLVGKKRWTNEDRKTAKGSYEMAEIILTSHLKRRKPPENLVELCARWRNPSGDAPQWYKKRIEKEIERRTK